MSELRFVNVKYSRIDDFLTAIFKQQLKNYGSSNFFKNSIFMYGMLSARSARTSTIEKIQIKKKQTPYFMAFLWLWNASKLNLHKTTPTSESNPPLLKICKSRKSITSPFTPFWGLYGLGILSAFPALRKKNLYRFLGSNP